MYFPFFFAQTLYEYIYAGYSVMQCISQGIGGTRSKRNAFVNAFLFLRNEVGTKTKYLERNEAGTKWQNLRNEKRNEFVPFSVPFLIRFWGQLAKHR